MKPRQVKAIIPPKLKDKDIYSVLQQEMRKYAPFLQSDFQKTVRNWHRSAPDFQTAVVVKPDSYSIQVKLKGDKKAQQIWNWLDDGTKAHWIRAKRSKYLRFRSGYGAGSSPNSRFVIASTKASGAFSQKKAVRHPGFAARNFSKLILQEHEKPFQRWMEAAMGNAAAAGGHAMKGK